MCCKPCCPFYAAVAAAAAVAVAAAAAAVAVAAAAVAAAAVAAACNFGWVSSMARLALVQTLHEPQHLCAFSSTTIFKRMYEKTRYKLVLTKP